MAGGFRIADPDETSPELAAAIERYSERFDAQQPGPLPALPEMGPGPDLPPASAGSWLQDWQQRPAHQTSFLSRLTTPLPWEERAIDAMFASKPDQMTVMRHSRPMADDLPALDPTARYAANDAAMGWGDYPPPQRPPPQSNPKTTRGPMVKAPAKAAQPRGPKTALALHFARVMGMEAPGEMDSPEELAFAKAAHQAMLKMSKGQSVAKFLSQMNSAKASATFRQLMNSALTKPPAQGTSKPPLNPS